MPKWTLLLLSVLVAGCGGAANATSGPSPSATTPPNTGRPAPTEVAAFTLPPFDVTTPTPLAPSPTPQQTSGLVNYEAGQGEVIISDKPKVGDVWRFVVDSPGFGEAPFADVPHPTAPPHWEWLQFHVTFTYVGTRKSVGVPASQFSLFGLHEVGGTWGPGVYVYPLTGSFPAKDWTGVPRDTERGYTLYFLVQQGFPVGGLEWTPVGDVTKPGVSPAAVWNFQRKP